MNYEIEYVTEEYDDNIVYIIKNVNASNYIEFKTPSNKIIGAFFDELEDVIGINTLNRDDVYSPSKLLILANDKISNVDVELVDVPNKQYSNILKWWNEKITAHHAIKDPFEEVRVKSNKLNDYFAESIEGQTKTYYLNPQITSGISVMVGENVQVNYDFINLNKIILDELPDVGRYNKRIYFVDKDASWLEDIDIDTNLDWNDICFIFETQDLEKASTTNAKKQLYIELYNKLNPYDDVEECDKLIEDWLILKQMYENGKELNI